MGLFGAPLVPHLGHLGRFSLKCHSFQRMKYGLWRCKILRIKETQNEKINLLFNLKGKLQV